VSLIYSCELLFTGHGRRISFKDNDEKDSVIEAFLATQEHLRGYSNTGNREPLFA
jgi:hypothetical protein